ncbi:MAG: hypothetical protein LKF01_00250 [Lactobacillus sp.]|jgi:hypothetical protein|nr:hypothetical protein [Lactobacillus sp.]MCH4067974.1 hypothetical protein [Lactobacillus sp.]MCI1304070.1 hypothetical protein [Lactobacillus sp.]MCI1329904.1 hypothetical protein [Lactobacillus sp.]MCI1399504.1 hypothetical protein [Lactobacillus sp.]
MKAWMVYDKNEPEHPDYVFAPTEGKAKSAALELLFSQTCADFTDMRVKRLPGVDDIEKESTAKIFSKLILTCGWDVRLPNGKFMNSDNYDEKELEEAWQDYDL